MTTNSFYEVASGNNNQAGLAKMNPQPKTSNIKHPAFVVGGDLAGDFDGSLFADIEWSGVTTSQWGTLLGQFGLSDTVFSNPVTLTLRKQNRTTWHHYNGTAYLEEPDWTFTFSQAKIRVVALVEIT